MVTARRDPGGMVTLPGSGCISIPARCATAAACMPTFAEYVPVVSATVSDGTRRAYGPSARWWL